MSDVDIKKEDRVSAYSNFIQDFPKRCEQILCGYENAARQTGTEVTLILAIASSAFVVPFERINPSNYDHVADDRFKACVKELGQLMNQSFVSWAPGKSWAFAASIPASDVRESQVEQWLSANPPALVDDKRNVGSLLTVIRNALSHGNIFTFPSGRSRNNQEIQILLFLSKQRQSSSGAICQTCGHAESNLLDEYNVLQATPQDFLALVRHWIQFLEGLSIPQQPTQVSTIELSDYSPSISAP